MGTFLLPTQCDFVLEAFLLVYKWRLLFPILCGKIIYIKQLSLFHHHLLWPWFSVPCDLKLVFLSQQCTIFSAYRKPIKKMHLHVTLFVVGLQEPAAQGLLTVVCSNLLVFSYFWYRPILSPLPVLQWNWSKSWVSCQEPNSSFWCYFCNTGWFHWRFP